MTPSSYLRSSTPSICNTISHSKVLLTHSDKEVSYYLPEGDVFINCGVTPLGNDVKVELKEVDVGQCMHLKIRGLSLMHVERLMLTQAGVVNQKEHEEPEQDE